MEKGVGRSSSEDLEAFRRNQHGVDHMCDAVRREHVRRADDRVAVDRGGRHRDGAFDRKKEHCVIKLKSYSSKRNAFRVTVGLILF